MGAVQWEAADEVWERVNGCVVEAIIDRTLVLLLILKQCSFHISNKTGVPDILESFENCSPESWGSSCAFIMRQPSGEHGATTLLHIIVIVIIYDLHHGGIYFQVMTDRLPIKTNMGDHLTIQPT